MKSNPTSATFLQKWIAVMIVPDRQSRLRPDVTPLCSVGVEVDCLGEVLGRADALQMHGGQVRLRVAVALLGRLGEQSAHNEHTIRRPEQRRA